LLGLLTEHGDSADDQVTVAIETPRGLLTACLRATGRKVYPINPMAVARYRDRHSAAGRKSDHGDAIVLANILRTDRHVHRPMPPARLPMTSSRPSSSLLTSTRTPGSSPASQGSARSPAPGCSPRPAMTGPASPMLKDSRPTPELRRSPAPAARPPPSCTAASKTSGSPPPDTSGPLPP